ncbi:MAG: nitrous oxide-stimulated promoter family protein [Xanthomonadales bacterium]|nr:nitrous oxide-stimulated promoter family protein [Xanthomonadales bacterium]NIX12483.1 nitrous oxide-stimulated promoter family protein [Xanthomonadales bacterium]
MEPLSGRLKREHATLVCMTGIYCADHHGSARGELCAECAALMRYAERRLAKCPYGEAKPTCAKCPIHCYKRAQREHVRAVMRYAGPRMPRRHPIRALTHTFDKLRRAVHPRELRRQRQASRETRD